jgi:3-hydroxyisobutyrate dehydrogenase
MNKVKIGWIGLGKMGEPMCKQLIGAGYPVTVYNRSKGKEEALRIMGAVAASSPASIIQQADVIILMVSDDRAVSDIFNGEQGLLHAKATGKLIINMSSVSPTISKLLAPLCKQQGNDYLDAPVSGSVKQAEEKALVIMAGSDETAFELAKPILETLGRLVMLLGPTGAGNATKLAMNTMLAFCTQGLAEAVVFAKRHDIKIEDFVTLLNNSAMGSPFIKMKGDAIMQNNYKAAFALKHLAKDLRLAKSEGLATPLGEVAIRTFQQAEPALGEEDIIAVIKQLSVPQ